jgi:hypothetical protein
MDKTRIEEFTFGGKNFAYIDLSDLKANESFMEATENIKPVISKYPPHSLYTITNIANIRFDTDTKKCVALYMEHNKPYVKYGAVIGFDGIKKIFVNSVFKLSGRDNMLFAFSKEKAVELLLKK